MIDVLRANVPSADVWCGRFEEWETPVGAFGLVCAAQAYHWLDPATRDERSAGALRRGGTVAPFWNRQYNPDVTLPFFDQVGDVYRRHAPHMAEQPGDRERRGARSNSTLSASPTKSAPRS